MTGSASASVGGATSGNARPVDSPFTLSQLNQAIPSRLAAPDGWSLTGPFADDGSKAQDKCARQPLPSCVGISAIVSADLVKSDSRGDTNAHFELYAFDSLDNAKVRMKEQLKDHKAQEGNSTPLTISVPGSDDAYAYAQSGGSGERFETTVFRVGTVVVLVFARGLPSDHDLSSFARLQAERLTIAAAGRNPDA
ncbi:hypothetical protein SAMN05216371_8224 [Streptomyces sp. TLI_053]|nr:hypothetical protein SAMN05216371_8224 [Streptomyces sp. TLI_053]